MKRVLMVAVAAASLCACTKTMKMDSHGIAVAGSEKEGMATLVVSDHQMDVRGTGWWLDVDVDGKKVGDMRRQTYIHVSVPPGHHTISVAYPALAIGIAPPLAVETDLEANKTYYFVWDTAPGKRVWPVDAEDERLRPVPRAYGETSIAGLTDRTKVKAQH